MGHGVSIADKATDPLAACRCGKKACRLMTNTAKKSDMRERNWMMKSN